MALEPILSRLVFVNIEVVQNDMELTIGETRGYLGHEIQEVDRGSSLLDVGQDSAAGNFQGSQQRLSSMPNILVGPTTGLFGPQREQRLGPIEGLNAGLFVHA